MKSRKVITEVNETKTLYRSEFHQQIGIVSPGLIRSALNEGLEILRCPKCELVYIKKYGCPDCGRDDGETVRIFDPATIFMERLKEGLERGLSD